jgi:D-aspartate ligase
MGRGAVREIAGVDPVACVIGDMDLIRPLALADVPCAVLSEPGTPPRFSRSARVALPWIDPATGQRALVDALHAFARSRSSPPALFYQTTASMLAISRHRDELRPALRFVIAAADLVEDLTDKHRFHLLAERLQLPVPPTRRLDPRTDPAPRQLDLRFPVLLKPVVRRFDQWGLIAPDAKAVEVDGPDTLRRLWGRLAGAGTDFLAQELIAGPESRIESYHAYVDAGGAVVAEFTGRKIRTRPAQFGYTTALTITDARDVIELGREVVQRLGLTGVAKLDFKRTPEGRLLLLEVNPRFTLWHHPAALAGINVPALVWADLTGVPRPAVRPAKAGVRWCDLWEDAAAARDVGELGVRWIASAASCEAKSGFAIDDPMPFVRAVAAPKLRRHLCKRAARLLGRRLEAAR